MLDTPKLITPTEAAALLERPARGRKVHTSTILRWGKRGQYQLIWCNGWKVDRESFTAWARTTHRLAGHGKAAPGYFLGSRSVSSSHGYLGRLATPSFLAASPMSAISFQTMGRLSLAASCLAS